MPIKIGPTELIIVLVIILMVFGVGKLPQVGSALGKGLRQFRKGASGAIEDATAEDPEPKQS